MSTWAQQGDWHTVAGAGGIVVAKVIILSGTEPNVIARAFYPVNKRLGEYVTTAQAKTACETAGSP